MILITVDYGEGGPTIDYLIKLSSKFYQLNPNFLEKFTML